MRYREIIESFDRVLPLRWEDRSTDDTQVLAAHFLEGGGRFEVRFKHLRHNPGLWEFSFTRNDAYELTKTGSAASVLATVMEAVRQFIREVHPRFIRFDAKRSDPSRLRLYPKLAARMKVEFPEYFDKARNKSDTSKYVSYDYERPVRVNSPPAVKPALSSKLSDEEWNEIESLLADLR